MKLESIILAILASRAPAAFSEAAIAARVNRSGLHDRSVTADDCNSALTILGGRPMGELVDSDVGPVTKDVVWYATDAGVRQWARDGRLYVGG